MVDGNIYTTKIVNKDYKGMRVDRFLVENLPQFSRAQLQRLVAQGMLSCDDDIIVDNAYKVREGDSYQLIVPPPAAVAPQPQDLPIEVVYEDEDLIVVNKAAGMTVHPAPGAPDKTLVNALLYHCRDLSGIGGYLRPGIVHRIDKDTSGLLVAAKNDVAHRGLSEQFAEHSIERTYMAAVRGVPSPAKGTIDADIGRSPYDRKKMAVVQKGGKHAVTHYELVEAFGGQAALVKCNLETGRTHQIRVHMSRIGHSLIGDPLYGKGKILPAVHGDSEIVAAVNQFGRQALHAKSLGFVHPRTQQPMSFDSELPTDFKQLLQNLRRL